MANTRVAERVEALGHAVPQADIGRQPVDEHEGRRARVAEALLHVQGNSGRHFDASLDWDGHWSRWGLTHGRQS